MLPGKTCNGKECWPPGAVRVAKAHAGKQGPGEGAVVWPKNGKNKETKQKYGLEDNTKLIALGAKGMFPEGQHARRVLKSIHQRNQESEV